MWSDDMYVADKINGTMLDSVSDADFCCSVGSRLLFLEAQLPQVRFNLKVDKEVPFLFLQDRHH
jgi:hypothetical protein